MGRICVTGEKSGRVLKDKESDFCILVGDGAPTNGTTGAGDSGIGSIYIDYTNGTVYVNKGGTKASPYWALIGTNA